MADQINYRNDDNLVCYDTETIFDIDELIKK